MHTEKYIKRKKRKYKSQSLVNNNNDHQMDFSEQLYLSFSLQSLPVTVCLSVSLFLPSL